jgi:hypothetical protein
LKNTLEIPFLLLSSGESHILRRIGGEIGCCMYLGVAEYDEIATYSSDPNSPYFPPLVKKLKAITNNIRKEK